MFNKKLICCYLYPITKYGYPPPAENTIKYIGEMASLGFRSIELEGIQSYIDSARWIEDHFFKT